MSPTKHGENLLKLVDADRLLMKLDKQLQSLPQRQKIARLDENHEQLNERSEQVAKLRLRQEMSIKALRDENDLLQDKIAASQLQIEENSDKYKEVAMLSTEIESLNKRAEKIAFDISELSAGIDKTDTLGAQLTERTNRVIAMRDELNAELESNTEKLDDQIEKLTRQRAKLVATLPGDLVMRYERQRELKQGIGAAALDGRICGACHIELTEGQRAKVKRELDENGIGSCPSCLRLLVV